MIKNQIVSQQGEKKKNGFSAVINQPNFQGAILNTLQDRNTAKRFTASIISAVTATPALKECDPMSIISAGLLGESLKLSPSPQLGHYYFVPFKQKAQFILGYKGYIQLATRSGQYRKITVLPIKQGELVRFNPIDEEIEVDLIEDENVRDSTPTAGYYAMFEYINGFRKAMYWSKEKMLSYADKYSPAFSLYDTGGQYGKVSYADYEAGNYNKKDEWKYSSFWYKDFDSMACKTMLRQIISKWGIMSIDLQRAYESDMGVISENGSVEYIEESETDVITEAEETASPPIPEKLPRPEEAQNDSVNALAEEQDDFSMIMEGFEA